MIMCDSCFQMRLKNMDYENPENNRCDSCIEKEGISLHFIAHPEHKTDCQCSLCVENGYP